MFIFSMILVNPVFAAEPVPSEAIIKANADRLNQDLNSSPLFYDFQPIRFLVRLGMANGQPVGAIFANVLPSDFLCGEPSEVMRAFLDDALAKHGWGAPILVGSIPGVALPEKDWHDFEAKLFVKVNMALDQSDAIFAHKRRVHLVHPLGNAVIDVVTADWKNLSENAEKVKFLNINGDILKSAECDPITGFIHVRIHVLAASLKLKDPTTGKMLDWRNGTAYDIANFRLNEMMQQFWERGNAKEACEKYDREVSCFEADVAFRPRDAINVQKYADYLVAQIDQAYHALSGTTHSKLYEF